MNLILFDPGELVFSSGDEGLPLQASGTVLQDDVRAVHLFKVLHKKTGDAFDAGVLGGPLGKGVITKVRQEGAELSLLLDTAPPPRMPLRLAAGFPRPIQIRRLLRDAASMGLDAVDFAGTDLGEKSYRDTKLFDDGGARSALIEGAVQARDTRLPVLSLYPDLDAWLKARPWPSGAFLAAADNLEPKKLRLEHWAKNAGQSADSPGSFGTGAVLAVGPERGWSSRERELLQAAGFLRFSMGSRALRTETACIAAAALVLFTLGCWDG